ncbi:MAG: HlyD family efflux transporter periplasmic adaptor subunit [Burkholderiaceae bacterium]
MTASSQTVSNPPAPGPAKSRKRRAALIVITILLLLIALAYGIWWLLYASHYESTDDAYVAGNVVQVTPQIGGTVVAINVDDTDVVQAGAPLIRLDPADADVALRQAEAQLAQTVREVRTLFTNNQALAANVALRSTDVQRARADLARRQELIGTGAVSREEVEHAKSALLAAESALQATREQLASNRALTDNTTIARHPNVQRAAAQLRSAYLARARTELPAPISGYVAKRSVQVGQRVAAGTPLLSIVPLDTLWVDANFKEVQIARMRIGQPVTLHADSYGSDVEYHGKVVGLAAGTGSAFALLPAQNASGNWIKVVQRLPVRISLDPKELAAHPLRIGLSMRVTVDIERAEGTSLTGSAVRNEIPYQTDVFEIAAHHADDEIAAIIAANAGKDAGVR